MTNHLKRLEVIGYRGFEHLKLGDLGDINVIVGKNNVGKTALFESLVLLGQPCNIDNSLAINELRGLKKVAGDTNETYSFHFNQRRTDIPIRIVGFGRAKDKRELTIRMDQGSEIYPERHERPKSTQDPFLSALLQQRAIRFDYKRTDGTLAWAIVVVAAGQEKVLDSTLLPQSYIVPFASTWRLVGYAPEMYTEAIKGGQEGELLAAIRAIAPEIDQIRMLTYAGEPTLFASTADTDLMPLQLFGDGVTRVTSWVLSLLRMKDSILLIDEIENGIHHSALTNVWRVLISAAKEHNVQLFATTHSYEALTALTEARSSLGSGGPRIRVIRLQRVKGEIHAVPYNEEVLTAAVTSDVEVR